MLISWPTKSVTKHWGHSLTSVKDKEVNLNWNYHSIWMWLLYLVSLPTGYRLVIICSNEEEEKSLIVLKLHNCRRPFAQVLDVEQCQHYLKSHFTESTHLQPNTASSVDHEKCVDYIGISFNEWFCVFHSYSSCVRLVTSYRSGMGKSLFIQRMVEKLQLNIRNTGKACVTVPLHGPKVTHDVVMDYLEVCMQESACTIFHLDIAPTVCSQIWMLMHAITYVCCLQILSEMDTILFSLLILRGLADSQGRVWRCHPNQLYAVEVTLPEKAVCIHAIYYTYRLETMFI